MNLKFKNSISIFVCSCFMIQILMFLILPAQSKSCNHYKAQLDASNAAFSLPELIAEEAEFDTESDIKPATLITQDIFQIQWLAFFFFIISVLNFNSFQLRFNKITLQSELGLFRI